MITLNMEGEVYLWGEFVVPMLNEDGGHLQKDSVPNKILSLYTP